MTAQQRARRAGAAAVMAGFLVLLGGCSGRADDADDAMASDTVSDDADGAGSGDASTGGGEEAAEGAVSGERQTRASGLAVDTAALARRREVIRTGEMWVTVDDVEDAAGDVRAVAGEAGGFVGDERVRARDGEADVTVRVPAADFDEVRAGIAELGEVGEQTVQAQDVTAEIVDVETRIDSLRASVDRLQDLLGGAGDVAQLAAVEGELAARETELEALLGQQRVLEEQVALATLTVHLSEEDAPAPSEDAAGFRDGLRRGWAAAVDGARAVTAALGFVLPFTPVVLVGGLALRWWVRRRSAPAASSAPPAPASST